MLVAAFWLDGRHLRYRFTLFSCVGMDNLNQWIGDRQSFERARHPKKKKSVRFLDDRSGSLFFEGFIVTDDAGFLSFGHLWLQSPRFCFYRPSRDLSSLQVSCSVATAICIHEILWRQAQQEGCRIATAI